MLIALPVAAQQMFFYPSQGQSPEQQTKDQGECHVWAVQQTGFDPANPPVAAPAPAAAPAPGGQVIRGAARGTVLGVVGGAIAGDAGKGAAIGALVGGMRRRDDQMAQAQQQAAAQQQYDAQLAQQRDGYNRALAACMQGRGYGAS